MRGWVPLRVYHFQVFFLPEKQRQFIAYHRNNSNIVVVIIEFQQQLQLQFELTDTNTVMQSNSDKLPCQWLTGSCCALCGAIWHRFSGFLMMAKARYQRRRTKEKLKLKLTFFLPYMAKPKKRGHIMSNDNNSWLQPEDVAGC